MVEATGTLEIRPERPEDRDAIRDVVAAAFASDVQPALVDRIRSSGGYVPDLALVAVVDGRIAGHVMISDAVVRHAAGERRVSMLSPLAVVPGKQGHGIGGALVRAALERADDRGEALVVLEGSPAYYRRFGFESASRYGITMPLPEWAPAAAAQVVRLRTYRADDPTLRGDVVYPPAFDGVE